MSGRFYVAALAGQSGSGKSLVGERLRELGADVIDSDLTARTAVQKGSPCLRELTDEFSRDILLPDGSLDRKKLGAICFSSDSAKKRLDEITHPYIISMLKKQFRELRDGGRGFCVVEAPALFESGLDRLCDYIIAVTAPYRDKICRIAARDGLSPEAAAARLARQIPESELAARAGAVIENSGTAAELRLKTDALYAELCERFR